MKTRNSKDISNGNTSANKTKADATVPDGIAPIARTEEMSDDLSEETLVNGESCETTNNPAGNKNLREMTQCEKKFFFFFRFFQ